MATHFTPGRIVVGGDIRPTSEGLKRALAKGLMDSGVDVLDLGVSGTEEIYFAAFHLDVDGGIEVTASHNPLDYNGMKLVKRGAQPISGDSELRIIQELVQENAFAPLSSTPGSLTRYDIVPQYVDHLLGYIDLEVMKPLCIVADSGNGVAGHAFYDRLQQTLRQFRFNAFVAKLCQPYYADKGRPSIRKRDRCVILSSSRLALFPGLRGGSRGGFFSSSRMCSPRWRQLPAKGDTSAPQVTRRTAFFRLKAMPACGSSASMRPRPS